MIKANSGAPNFAASGKPLTVKDDNIVFYEIEIADDGFKLEDLPKDEQELIALKNEKMEENLKQYLIAVTTMHLCSCHQPRIIQREMAKSKLLQADGVPHLQYQQEDFDNYVYGVVMLSDHGVYSPVPLLVVLQCQVCQNMTFVGDVRPLMRHLGDVYMRELSAMELPAGVMPAINLHPAKEKLETVPTDVPTKKPQPTFIMEDVETGEKTSADSLAEALFGTGAVSGDLQLTDVPDKPNT